MEGVTRRVGLGWNIEVAVVMQDGDRKRQLPDRSSMNERETSVQWNTVLVFCPDASRRRLPIVPK